MEQTETSTTLGQPNHRGCGWHVSWSAPGSLLATILALQLVLLLGESSGVIRLPKGWAVLGSVGAMLIGVVGLMACAFWAVIRRRRFQIGLSALLMLVAAVAIPSGWFVRDVHQAQRQKEAIETLKQAGFHVDYVNVSEGYPVNGGKNPADFTLLERLLGFDFFHDANTASYHFLFDGPLLSDASLAKLRGLPGLRCLSIGVDSSLDNLVPSEANAHKPPLVTDAGLAHLKALKQLRHLSLSDGSHVTDQSLLSLSELVELRELHLFNTAIAGSFLKNLQKNPKLAVLDINCSPVEDEAIEQIAAFENLRFLGLRDTKITDASLAVIGRMRSLEYLDLSETQISDAGLKNLSAMNRLRTLVLCNTQVTDVGLAHLHELVNLEELYLTSTQVSNQGLKHLTPLKRLKRLEISDTKVDDLGRNELRAILHFADLEFDSILMQYLGQYSDVYGE